MSLQSNLMSDSKLALLPQRNRGNHLDKCQKVKLLCNLFKVDFNANLKIYIHSVKISPQIPHENGKKFRSLLLSNRVIIERMTGPFVISGRTIFGTKIQSVNKKQVGLTVQYESTQYHIILKNVKQITLSDIYSPQKQVSGSAFNFLNNMVRNFFHQMQYTQIGKSRKYFDPNSRKKIQGANVSVFKGYSSNFTLLQNGLFLRIDPNIKIIQSQSALDVINKIYKRNSTLSKVQKRLLVEQQLIGKNVMTNYGKNRCYRIQSLIFDVNLQAFQFNQNGKNINILQYYRQTYDININAKKQPLVRAQPNQSKSQNNKQIILIPELLLMGGLPDDFDQRKRREISEVTIVPPSQKLSQIQNIFNKINNQYSDFSPQTIGEKLGIKFSSTPTTISAKQLNFPELLLGNRDKVEEHKSTNFMLFNKYLYSHDIPVKANIFMPSDFDFSPIKRLMESTCKNIGLQYKIINNTINYSDYKNAMKNIENIVKLDSENKTSNIFWFIITPNFKNQYKHLKRLVLKTEIQTNSQVTVTTTLQKKGVQSIFTKILLQMAAKVGNKLWVPKINQKIINAGVLLIGIEFTKDSQFKDKNIISYCCNFNKQFSSFYSNYIYDESKKLKTYMKQIVFDCLNQYMTKNQSPPKEVFVIKNGTARSDIGTLIQAEVIQIKDILKSISKSYDPIVLTYIILDKNASQKFFSTKGKDIVNPNSGALINSEAVRKNFQFYLIAQQCNRGTVKPTYYKVVHSDSSFQEGLIEQLIYSQCFNYMNWSGSIKVPGTLQNAKKLGSFIGQYLNKDLSLQRLQQNLYYI